MDNEFSQFEQYVPDAAPDATPDGSGSRFDQFEQYAPDSVPDASTSGFDQFEQYAPSDGSLTPETDKALSQVGSELPTGEELNKAAEAPDTGAGPWPAIVATAKGMVAPLKPEDLAYQSIPLGFGQFAKHIADAFSQSRAGKSNEEVARALSPEYGLMKDAWKEPIGSQKWWGAVIPLSVEAAQYLPVLHAAFKLPVGEVRPPAVGPEFLKPQTIEAKLPLAEEVNLGGELNAEQPSNAQVETGTAPLGIEAGTAGEETQPSSSDYAVRETIGKEPVVAGETPITTEPVISPESPATEQPTEALSPIPETAAPVPTEDTGARPVSPIKAAAVKNLETGQVWTGRTHSEAAGDHPLPENYSEYGFVTEDGEFLTSDEAGKRAVKLKQVPAGEGYEHGISAEDFNAFKAKSDTGSKPVAPRLLPGETQGDLISSTQEEPLKLVGEETADFEAQMTAEQKAEFERMKAESEQEQLAGLEDYQQRGGQELVDAISSLGGLRETAPDFGMVREAFLGKSKHGTQASARSVVGDIRYGDIFKKNAPHEDALVQALRERGFDIETPGQLADILDTRLKTGKEIWGMEARAEEADFTGHQGYAMGVRGQPDLTTKIIKNVQSAVDAIQTGLGRKPLGAIEPPTLNLDTGGIKPPPPDSIFAPDTPPGDDPVPIYATRVNSAFKRWWEKFWPRDLAVQKLDKTLSAKGKEPSPVISAHQEILRTNMNFMQNFSEQPWWRALRGRPESEIIDVENRVIKEYRKHIENGVDREQAYKGAVSKAPKWFQDIVRQRESRIPIETKAAEELGVDPPQYTGDPYIARLTNEEGKDVVDLNPRLSNIGKQIRTTIGSFDNSREHVTMKDGIAAGTQYEPVARAVWLREMNSIRLESTADLVRSLKEKGVLFDKKKAAFDASPAGKISLVRGLGGKQYWARSPEEAVFLEQNISSVPRSPLGRIQQLANTYVRNPSLVNPLPHVTKNMFFKYLMARINNATFKADVADFARATPSELKARFDRVMPFSESAERMPQLTAREVGTWAEKASTRGMKVNDTSAKFIFKKADPVMRFSLWKSYVRKGMSDQEAANHVWIDLVRYDANSGGMNFWKSIPFNFFVPWRTGTYVTLVKALTSHPIRTLAFIGAVEYLRELRYRKSGRWTHLPVDYIDAPLAEAVESGTKVHDFKSGREAAQMTAMTAATTLVFGPGGGQAPSTIKDVMAVLQNDPQQKARVMNMFWGLSQIYDLPREWNAFQKDNNPQHLVNLLTSAALAEHSALKYEPRRLMKWLPEWMPGLQKSEIVQQAEQLQARVAAKAEKGKATYEARHGVSANFERSPETQQLEELGRAAFGARRYGKKKTVAAP